MSHFACGDLTLEHTQCVVCEKPITEDNWVARVKHGDRMIILCSHPCAKAFYAQQLPLLRRLAVLASLRLSEWPRQGTSCESIL